MEDELIHELAAAYALDALDPEQERAYEAHLAGCHRCQEDVAAFSETAAALAYAVPPAQPPSALRARVLAGVHAERPKVVVLRPRWAYPALAVASVVACAAIGLGAWAAMLNSQLGSASALHVLPLRGASGAVVLGGEGQAALVVSGLAPAPVGKTYEVWVRRGKSVLPAGLFSSTGSAATVHLSRLVPRGGMVGVTLEPAGGSARPSEPPLFTSSART